MTTQRNKLTAIFAFIFIFFTQQLVAQQVNIIPYPRSIQTGPGSFTFNSQTKIYYAGANNKDLQTAMAPLVFKLQQAAGIQLNTTAKKPFKNVITVALTDRIMEPEGYHLDITPEKITIEAAKPAGIFYAVQSLLQLLPVAIESPTPVPNLTWMPPAVIIDDAPVFAYRGLMMDVVRHFMPYAFLEKLIDLMAMQKMNTLHLHLTDSQGWRFESKKYPRLNTISPYRKGTPMKYTYDYASDPADTLYGGYYTQAQLKQLVAYAAKKFITIIPEIEMPAHSRSALAAYPGLACLDSTGKPFPYPAQIQDEYCTKDSTFIFLDDILTEVMNVFPSKYIHIGGDEAEKANWKKCPIDIKRMKDLHLANVDELQSYFMKRIEKFVNQHGRSVIGWDEILEGGLAPNAAVMSWRGEEGGIAATELGHKVVMTPEEPCYFDHYQSLDPSEPPAFGGLNTLSDVYAFKPVPPELTVAEGQLISGAQGNLWTEYVPTYTHAEYMYFPRSTALAEVDWSHERQTYDDFISRLLPYLDRLDEHNVNYSRHLFNIGIITKTDPATHQISAETTGVPPGFDIYYTTDGSRPTARSIKYTGPIKITGNENLNIGVIYKDRLVDDVQKAFTLNKATGKPSTLKIPPSKEYNKSGDHGWNDGILGSDNRYNDGEWLGWNGKDFEGTIDLGAPTEINTVITRFFNKPNDWVYNPQSVTLSISDNGADFKDIASQANLQSTKDGLLQVKLAGNGAKARYVRITAKNLGAIPKGNNGEGNPPWLFVDEVEVE
jgi:hexosaminidase